jgi:hypothetical protein
MCRIFLERSFQTLAVASYLWASACSSDGHSQRAPTKATRQSSLPLEQSPSSSIVNSEPQLEGVQLAQAATPLPPPPAPAPAPAPAPTRPPVPLLPLLRAVPLCVLLCPSELADGTLKEEAAEAFPDSNKLDPALRRAFEEALERCFEMARPVIMMRYFGSRKPAKEECNELIDKDSQGQPLKDRKGRLLKQPTSRAMQMGNEVEAEALKCLENETVLLDKLSKQGYAVSTHPTYQRNPSTGKVEHLPDTLVENMLRSGQHKNLVGSIEPDVVVHPSGFPSKIQAVYDFKFSCLGYKRQWPKYDKEPHKDKTQGQVYEDFLGVPPIIIPR